MSLTESTRDLTRLEYKGRRKGLGVQRHQGEAGPSRRPRETPGSSHGLPRGPDAQGREDAADGDVCPETVGAEVEGPVTGREGGWDKGIDILNL